MSAGTIRKNFASIQQRIEEAAATVGRDPSDIEVVGVSKNHPLSSIVAARKAGLRLFGESYAQELSTKVEELGGGEGMEWHFIGHLQRNKVAMILPHVAKIHAVDSERLARRIDREAEKLDRVMPVLLQVNTSGEASKYGCFPGGAMALAERIMEMEHLELRGLMTLAARADDSDDARPMFRLLRDTRDLVAEGLGCDLPELSMGMSEDFEVAIEEGSTCVRLGTLLFGPRPE